MSRITISLPEVIHNRISLLAQGTSESMSTIINKLISYGLNYDTDQLSNNNTAVDEHCQQLIIQMNALLKSLSAKMLQYNQDDFETLQVASVKKINELKHK